MGTWNVYYDNARGQRMVVRVLGMSAYDVLGNFNTFKGKLVIVMVERIA